MGRLMDYGEVGSKLEMKARVEFWRHKGMNGKGKVGCIHAR